MNLNYEIPSWELCVGFVFAGGSDESGSVKHYYILCLFAKGQTKNLKGLRSKNKKPEGFAKQKKSAIFAMQHASQLVVHHPSLIYNVPLIIATLL
jgi:hypothetical protein